MTPMYWSFLLGDDNLYNELEKYKIMEDNNLRLELVLGIISSRQFYYKIYLKEINKQIGLCGIRLEKNNVNYFLGNIEYEIFPEYRGNNYSYSSCLILSSIAKDNNVDKLIITANPKNIASIKTIEKLGARFIEIGKIPKKNRLYQNGERLVSIYEWNLEKRGEKII